MTKETPQHHRMHLDCKISAHPDLALFLAVTAVHLSRCLDIPHKHRSKRRFCKILGVLPYEPRNMDPFWVTVSNDFYDFGPEAMLSSSTQLAIDGCGMCP